MKPRIMKAKVLLPLFLALAVAFHVPGASAQYAPSEPAKPDRPAAPQEFGADKSYVTPLLEIPVFLLLLNGADRLLYPDAREPNGQKTYDTTPSTTWDHIAHGHWVYDRDPFGVNQFEHPYQGSVFHGFARSAGLNYWEALLYDNYGSYLWKMAGETGDPSINDMITTGQAGSLFGEALFRMASLVLETDDGRKPGFWRELGAAVISPSMAANRLVFGERFSPVFRSHDPATFWRLRLGVSQNFDQIDNAGSSTVSRYEGTLDYTMAYGLPGKPGYSYTRPFDYFHFESSVAYSSKRTTFDNVMIRGLLFGTDYGPATPTAASGAFTAAMTTSRRRSSAFRARPSRWGRRSSRGSRREWRFRARCSAAPAMAQPGTSHLRVCATTTTALLRRGSSLCA